MDKNARMQPSIEINFEKEQEGNEDDELAKAYTESIDTFKMLKLDLFIEDTQEKIR